MTALELATEIASHIEDCPPTSAWVFLAVNTETLEATTLSNRPDDLDVLGKIMMGLGHGERLPN